ncbi:MAG: hypothetical protein Q8P67_02480, partial [archaeon]|nr:hypothetical protein [archaeon]
QPSIPSQPKPSLNPAPSHSTSNPHITPFPQPASLERNSSALQISGPIKVKHTTAQDLLNSLDPKGSPSLKATPVPTGGKPKKSGISLMKGLAAGLKKGKKPSSDKSSHAESTSPRPSVSSPMNVSKTTEAPASFNENRQLQSSLPVAAQPILAPPPVEDLPVPEVPARRPILPPKDSSLSLSSSAPIPAISKPSQLPVSCSHCGVQNTLPPRVLSIACEGCGRSVDAPPPPADDGIPPLPPARGNVSEVESAQRRLTDAKAQAQRFRQEAERLQQRIKEADAQQEQASRELDEALERQRLAEIAERERLERERLEQERLEKERLEKERLERERLEQERIAAERQAALELERKENEERAARQRAEEARLAEARAAEAEAQRLAAHATEQQAEEEEDYDESQMMDCSDCAQPNIFPTGCYRIACWNCNTPMSMTPPATQSAASTAAPAVTPASVPAVTPAAADAPQPEHEGDREEEADLDGLPEANCLSCGELNYLPLSAPRVACWQCGSVVEAPTLPDVVAPQPEVREASVGEDEDDELQADCPDCGEPNIFPEGAPRIACWSCEKAIDRPA